MTDRTAAALEHEHQAHQRRHALKLARSPEALSIALDDAAHDAREASTATAARPCAVGPDWMAAVWVRDETGAETLLCDAMGRTPREANRRARLIAQALRRMMAEGGEA